MEQKNKNSNKKKVRVKMQQNFVSVCCMIALVFVVGWGAISITKNTSFIKTSASTAVEKKSSSSAAKKTTSSEKKETTSSVKKEETKTESKKPAKDDKEDKDSEKDNTSSSDDTSSLSQDELEDHHVYEEATDTEDDLSDAVFIGDSRTVGLSYVCDRPEATFYCAVGLNVETVMTNEAVTLDDGTPATVLGALSQDKEYKRIYINFGTNELGWPYVDGFINEYVNFVSEVQTVQPNATIYVESILPVTAGREAEGDAINNSNIVTFNQYIKQMADDNGYKYLPCNESVMNVDGRLPDDASTDGIHLVNEYCIYWLNYIIDNT